MIPLPCGGSPTQGGGWGVGSRSTTESGNAESDGKTTESDPGYCTVTGGLPRHRGIEIHITVCVGVWFCGWLVGSVQAFAVVKAFVPCLLLLRKQPLISILNAELRHDEGRLKRSEKTVSKVVASCAPGFAVP